MMNVNFIGVYCFALEYFPKAYAMTTGHEMDGNPQVKRELASVVTVTPEGVREEAERVLADPVFRHSERSRKVLRFIVDRTLNRRHDDLKERIIGIEVFGRAPDYDTGNDSIVRVVTTEVRKRLAEYYSKPEHAHELRITLPLRSYIAEFRQPGSNQPELNPRIESGRAKWWPAFWRWCVWGLAGIGILSLVFGVAVQREFPAAAIDRFWEPVVNTSGSALICVDSPYQANGDSIALPPSSESSAQEVPFYDVDQRVYVRYVRMFDANAAKDLDAYLLRKGKNSAVLPTGSAQLARLQSSPLILYGMFLNEWAEKAGIDLRFRFRHETDKGLGLRWIEDMSNPANRNWLVHLTAPNEQVNTDYALITRVRDKSTGRWLIGISGLTGVGTLAANQVVLNPEAMANITAGLPKDWYRKNLQILLEAKVVQGGPGPTRVLTAYTW